MVFIVAHKVTFPIIKVACHNRRSPVATRRPLTFNPDIYIYIYIYIYKEHRRVYSWPNW